MCHEPSSCWTALSVGAHVGTGIRFGEHHRGAPPALSGQHRPLLLLLGAEVVIWANPAPPPYIHAAGLAPSMFVQLQQRLRGRYAAEFLAQADLVPAAVDEGAHRLLEVRGQGRPAGGRVEHRRVAVALDERRGERAFGKPGHLAEHLLGGVPVEVDERAGTQCLVDAEHLGTRLKTWSRTLLL